MRIRLRKRTVVIGAIGLILVVFVAATLRLFVFPTTNRARHADAILVLGGYGPRWKQGIALATDGYAPLLVMSYSYPISTVDCGRLFYAGPKVQVVCFRPAPFSTQGEARFFGQLAKERHLHSVIVVSDRAQTTRARIRVSRCFSGTVLMDPSANPSGVFSQVYAVAYEWGALIKAETLQRSC